MEESSRHFRTSLCSLFTKTYALLLPQSVNMGWLYCLYASFGTGVNYRVRLLIILNCGSQTLGRDLSHPAIGLSDFALSTENSARRLSADTSSRQTPPR